MAIEIPEWVVALRAAHADAGSLSAHGTQRLIDSTARLRGTRSVEVGQVVSLARCVQVAEHAREDRPSRYELSGSIGTNGRLVSARDRLTVDNHGFVNTHIDGLNHIGIDGIWHDGSSAVLAQDGPSIADWETGFVTRAVFLDIPSVRGTPWVEPGAPVSAEDLAAAESRSGAHLEPGDAVLLYMGRDEYERQQGPFEALTAHGVEVLDEGSRRPGLGEEGARWLSERSVAALLWDFMEASEAPYVGHLLIWALGLALVDNCDFAACRRLVQRKRTASGLLCLSPLRITGATGCLVNPLLLG